MQCQPPLTPKEKELYAYIVREWSKKSFGMGTYKIGPPSGELVTRLTQLGERHQLRVIFYTETGADPQQSQHFVHAVRRAKQQAP